MDNTNLERDPSMDVAAAIQQRQNAMATPTHGAYVPGENGQPGGIYIDKQEEIRQATANPHVDAIEDYLKGMDARIADAKAHHDGLAQASNVEKDVVAKVNTNNPETADIKKVSELFARFEPTATGLDFADSKAAQEYKQKMEALESGNVDIENLPATPTPLNNQAPTQEELAPVESDSGEIGMPESTTVENKVVFNVDRDKADTFINSLSEVEREKVVTSDSIVINEIKTLDLPVATRTISSVDEFKRILPKQSHSGVVDTVLLNSGIIATFKGCGALAMATLLPDGDTDYVDYAKRFNFCYENLVTTSIGKLSFNDFCARTHINDLPSMIFAILRASEPDDNMIMLKCAGCNNEYEVPYKLSQLLDQDSVDDMMDQRIESIVKAKDVYDDAKALHDQSPIFQSKYVEFDMGYQKLIVELRATNGSTIISRIPVLGNIRNKFSAYVAGIIPYVPSIRLKYTPEGETQEQVYLITAPEAIAELLRDMEVSMVKAIGDILSEIVEYPSPTYSFKGPYKCPKCGRIELNVECSPETLLFHRVGQAIF